MDQDKAQQSIDTLSEKVNEVVRSVRVSCSPENDYRGEKDYRSVFGVQEIECLYVDTEVLNKQFEGEPWEGKMTVRLFRLENGKGQCLSVKAPKSYRITFNQRFDKIGRASCRERV